MKFSEEVVLPGSLHSVEVNPDYVHILDAIVTAPSRLVNVTFVDPVHAATITGGVGKFNRADVVEELREFAQLFTMIAGRLESQC